MKSLLLCLALVSSHAFAACPVINGDYELYQVTYKNVQGDGNLLVPAVADISLNQKITFETIVSPEQCTLKATVSIQGSQPESSLLSIDEKEHFLSGPGNETDDFYFRKYVAGGTNTSIVVLENGSYNDVSMKRVNTYAGNSTITKNADASLQIDQVTYLYNVQGTLTGKNETQLIYKKK